jgi:hypothetical protein
LRNAEGSKPDFGGRQKIIFRALETTDDLVEGIVGTV